MSPNLLDIDLDAALKKISQRQSLNQVHYAVQLVRDALTRSPDGILITNRGNHFSLVHDGDYISDDEWSAIKLGMLGRDPSARNHALNQLEMRFGVGLISILLSGWPVHLQSGKYRVRSDGSKVVFNTTERIIDGCDLAFERPAKLARDEKKELAYFCQQCEVPIIVNGKPMKSDSEEPASFLTASMDDVHGHATVGLAAQGNVCSTAYLKHGVRFGLKYTHDPSGSVTAAEWNSRIKHFEPQYNESVSQGDRALGTLTRHLYHQVPKHFEQLPKHEQRRVKTLLMRYRTPAWEKLYGGIKLFAAGRQDALLSLKDLRKLARRFGYVPYTPKANGVLPDTPTLESDEVFFLKKLGLRLGMVRSGQPWYRRFWHRIFGFPRRAGHRQTWSKKLAQVDNFHLGDIEDMRTLLN